MPEIPDRESLEVAAIGNQTSLETTPRENFRNGFEAGYRAALAVRPVTTLDAAVEALDRTVDERSRKAVERLSTAREDTEQEHEA